jgi:hypothetical protein
MQALLSLDPYENKIGDEGAQYLSDALQYNAVRKVLVSSVSY